MSASSGDLEQRARQYVIARGNELERRLGFGRDGSVYATVARTAVKSYGSLDPFERELDCYRRLREHDVGELLGHRVPRLLDWDERLMVLEMSIVNPPYLLDFAGAYLDDAPDFPAEVIDQWHQDKFEQFGDRWPDVIAVLEFLKSRYGIHLLDIHPANITFG